MTYERFEQLPVWQAAMDLAQSVYELTDDRSFMMPGDLSSQLRRAAPSISNNIAEGFERGTTAELLTFLYIARGSAGEARSMLVFCERRGRFEHLKSQISDLKFLAESCSRQIRAWADSLQNSDIPGQRRLTDKTRLRYDSKKRSEEFTRRIDEAVRSNLTRQQAERMVAEKTGIEPGSA